MAIDDVAPVPPDTLGLHSTTGPQWAPAMLAHVDRLLVEQAHLEKKAAAGALAFLFRLPAEAESQRQLSALAREELVHFERTLRLLQARGVPFGPVPPCDYAERLKAGAVRTMPARLVDELVVAALIEARSCERMQLLALALRGSEPVVAAFYADLVEAEARHEGIYLELASAQAPAAAVAARWHVLAAHEAAVLRGLPCSPHLHGGAVEAASTREPG
jgi:tRNA-(ms[2]io[6]A)-hydroxylase